MVMLLTWTHSAMALAATLTVLGVNIAPRAGHNVALQGGAALEAARATSFPDEAEPQQPRDTIVMPVADHILATRNVEIGHCCSNSMCKDEGSSVQGVAQGKNQVPNCVGFKLKYSADSFCSSSNCSSATGKCRGGGFPAGGCLSFSTGETVGCVAMGSGAVELFKERASQRAPQPRLLASGLNKARGKLDINAARDTHTVHKARDAPEVSTNALKATVRGEQEAARAIDADGIINEKTAARDE